MRHSPQTRPALGAWLNRINATLKWQQARGAVLAYDVGSEVLIVVNHGIVDAVDLGYELYVPADDPNLTVSVFEAAEAALGVMPAAVELAVRGSPYIDCNGVPMPPELAFSWPDGTRYTGYPDLGQMVTKFAGTYEPGDTVHLTIRVEKGHGDDGGAE